MEHLNKKKGRAKIGRLRREKSKVYLRKLT